MAHWTSKHRGAIIGVAIALSLTLIGAGVTALAVLFGVAGYFVGKLLDGDLDLAEIRNRDRGRTQSPVDRPPYTATPATGSTPEAWASSRSTADVSSGARVG